jgi:hypothetical protein
LAGGGGGGRVSKASDLFIYLFIFVMGQLKWLIEKYELWDAKKLINRT